MINYNTESMHTVGKLIQSNGKELQGDLQTFWSNYQKDMTGAFASLTVSLTNFMGRCQAATQCLAQNRIDIGTKLDLAGTTAEAHENRIKQLYMGHLREMPQ